MPLGQLVQIASGRRNSSEAVADGLYPFFTCGREALRIDVAEHDREAVLLGGNNANAVFPVFYVVGKFTARQRVYVIWSRDTSILDNRYLYFTLKDLVSTFTASARGTTTLFITLPMLQELEIPRPDILVQREISSMLGAIDNRIDLLRQTNTTLESIAQALFKSWFIDFDPVRAKVEGREPEGMDAATAALFPNEFEESELGLIPKGWRIETLARLCESIFSGGTPDTRRPDFWDGELRWFSSGETRESVIVDTEKRINRAAVENSSTRLARPGDVLIASAGQGLTRGQTSFCAVETYINQSVVDVRTDPDKGHAAWTFYNLSRRYEEMRGLSDSHSIRGSLTTKLLAAMRLVCPHAELMQRFGDIASGMLNFQAENRRRVATLASLRDTLLPRLISGKLRLPEAQNRIEEALA